MRGFAVLHPTFRDDRVAFSPVQLEAMLAALSHTSRAPEEDPLFQAVTATAYWGFLRIGEFTAENRNGRTPRLRADGLKFIEESGDVVLTL